MDEGVRRVGTVIVRPAALFLGVFLFAIHGVATGQPKPRIIHVFVALADNQHQGIVPVPATLGNGDDPARNLYWGAAFGVRTFFRKSPEWKEIANVPHPKTFILERSIFQEKAGTVLLVADAYRGSEIKQALTDFFYAAAGVLDKEPLFYSVIGGVTYQVSSEAELVVYVGHDGLMDFPLAIDFAGRSRESRSAIILACASRSYFRDLLRASGATPLLWTTGLMAPEAYTLKAAVAGWMQQESKEQIRMRAAAAYVQYQKCSHEAAMRLFSSDW
jgi:hypothetical protein